MSPAAIVVTFLFYSVFGWILDTSWRSLCKRRYERGGFSRYPFSPIYGLGALLSLALVPVIHAWSYWLQWLFLSVLFGTYEYLCGALIVKTLRRRLWNYTKEPWDLKGHTTPLYALTWGALALLVAYIFQPALEGACRSLEFCAPILR